MQQMKKETEERALICAEKEGGGFLFLRRLVARLTDGFWEAVVRGFTGNRASLSVEFLGVLCLFSFAFCSALASLAVFPLRTYPVPFALFGAIGGFPVTVGKKECSSFGLSASVVIGVLIASLFLPHGLLLAFFVSALLVLRLLLGCGRLSEGVVFRALFAALFSALYALVSSFYYTSRAASVLNVFCAFLFSGVLTVLFSGVFVRWQAKEGTEKGGKAVFLLLPSQLSLYRTLSFLSFGFCVLYAVREIDFFGFSLSFVAATLVCLFVSRLCGGMEGALCGALLGFAAAGEGALCLVVSGLCFSLGLIHSQFAATALSFAASAGFLICFCSGEAFALFAADLLLSHLIFWALLRVLLHRLSPQEQSEPVALRSRAYLQEKLARLSEAFSSLSEVFYMATDARLSKEGELASRLVREASERVCASCRHSTDCHERNYGLTRSALNALSVQLQEKHSVSPADMEPYFKSRCRKAEALCREINRRYARACAADEMREEPVSLLCGEYGSISRLLSGEAEQIRLEETLSARQSLLAQEVLRALEIPHRTAYVSGGRSTTLTVTGVPLSRLSLSTEKLLKELGDALNMRFEAPEFVAPLSDCTMILRRRRALSLSCARLVCPAGRQAVSGDTTGFFESEEHYFYSLICDGMGSGRDAAFTSRLSSIFIEKLLTFSRETGVTLEMLNRFLLSRKEERFSTVDLLEIDFYTARANFIKAGAAASYVKRGTGLYRIASKTPPAGVLKTLSAEQTTLTLTPGDSVVMFSDGVAPSEESDAWFAETLAFAKEKDARALAAYLMEEARRHHGAAKDDMSICVLDVHAA